MRFLGSVVLIASITAALTSCAAYDDVLTRQILAQKDALGTALSAINDTTSDQFASQVRTNTSTLSSVFWDGKSDPANLGLREGALIVWDVSHIQSEVSFSAMIGSGERDTESDPLYEGPEPYFGASSIYTCFNVRAEVPSMPNHDNLSYNERACPKDLIEPLASGSVEVSVFDFSG
jgi:hypothetical protein